MPTSGGLSGAEVEALVKRYLSSEVGVVVRQLRDGLGFLCTSALGDETEMPRLFAVATHGGVLLRLDAATRDRLVESHLAQANAALPDWVVHLEPKQGATGAPPPDARVIGRPEEWVWVPIGEGAAFERRRPHIQEALAYCRHTIAQDDDASA